MGNRFDFNNRAVRDATTQRIFDEVKQLVRTQGTGSAVGGGHIPTNFSFYASRDSEEFLAELFAINRSGLKKHIAGRPRRGPTSPQYNPSLPDAEDIMELTARLLKEETGLDYFQ